MFPVSDLTYNIAPILLLFMTVSEKNFHFVNLTYACISVKNQEILPYGMWPIKWKVLSSRFQIVVQLKD